jgi:RimJ/RimL family protein N-acetyltransferase
LTEGLHIDTERLLLRPFLPTDLPAFAALWSDPATTGPVGMKPRSEADSRASFDWHLQHWHAEGYGHWAVLRRETGGFIGHVGMFRANRGYGPDFDCWPEAGWFIGRSESGQGLGHEATRAAHAWFDGRIGGRLVARITVGNLPSFRIADRLGYRPFRSIKESAGPTRQLLSRDAPGV